jgi:hypothetical protein
VWSKEAIIPCIAKILRRLFPARWKHKAEAERAALNRIREDEEAREAAGRQSALQGRSDLQQQAAGMVTYDPKDAAANLDTAEETLTRMLNGGRVCSCVVRCCVGQTHHGPNVRFYEQ